MPLVHTEDLIDAQEVARLIGLAQRNSVSLYLRKYADMPRPIIDLGPNRPRLWIRREIEIWVQHRNPVQRGRPRKSSAVQTEQASAFPGGKAPPLGGAAAAGGSETRLTVPVPHG